MVRELTVQKTIKTFLQNEYKGTTTEIYQGKEIKNIVRKKWAKVPDLLIKHDIKFTNPSYKKQVLQSPIGIEVKKSDTKIGGIARGMVNQLKESYQFETYTVNKEDTKINSMLFTTPNLIKTGYLSPKDTEKVTYREQRLNERYRLHELYIVKRFAWAINIGLLLKHPCEQKLIISYHNVFYDLFGKIIAFDTCYNPLGCPNESL